MKKFATVLLAAFMTACSKKEIPDETAGLGLDYFPLEKGGYVTFSVDSTVYIEIPKDTLHFSYQLKQRIGDSYSDPDGSLVHVIQRFVRTPINNLTTDFGPWRVLDVFAVRATNQKIEIQESNIRFTRLAFPVAENKVWDGNAGNTLGEQLYQYKNVESTLSINQIGFPNTLVVNEKDQSNLIEVDQAFKIYAKDVGLVSRVYHKLFSNNIEPGKTVFQRIESGLTYSQQVISYGKELY